MKTTTIAAVAVVSVLIVGVLSLNYVLTLQPHVEIASFNSTGISSGSSIGVVQVWFVLNLNNTGTGDGKDLTVTFSTNTTIESNQQFIYANSTVPHDCIAEFEMGEPCLLGTLKAEETKNFTFYWAVSFDFDAPPLTATLKSNQAILDQATITIPPIPNVKITNFVCLGIWHGTKLGLALDLFSLSYTNLGTIDVENLTITLNTSRTNENDADTPPIPYRYLDEYINEHIYHLESVKVNETKNYKKGYLIGLYNIVVEPFDLTVTLKCNDIILDQATIMIPISG
jgi:hypothetical protein